MAYIQVNHANLYYEEHGRGSETIVFCHSILFNQRIFDDQVEALKSSYRIVCFDFRGHGKSEVTDGGYDLENLTTDTVKLIKKLDCNPCHFVGLSMGGMVVMRVAARHPELIKTQILIDTYSEQDSPTDRLKNRALLWIAGSMGLKPVANRIITMFFGNAFLKDPERKDLQKTWKEHFLANDRRGIIKAVRGALSRQGITSEIHKIKTPTLILWGDQDKLTDRRKTEIMHQNITGSELKIIPRAGHIATVEEPAFVSDAITDFLARY